MGLTLGSPQIIMRIGQGVPLQGTNPKQKKFCRNKKKEISLGAHWVSYLECYQEVGTSSSTIG